MQHYRLMWVSGRAEDDYAKTCELVATGWFDNALFSSIHRKRLRRRRVGMQVPKRLKEDRNHRAFGVVNYWATENDAVSAGGRAGRNSGEGDRVRPTKSAYRGRTRGTKS